MKSSSTGEYTIWARSLDEMMEKAVKPAGNVEEIRTRTTAKGDGAKVREEASGPLSVLSSPQASGG